MFKSDLVLVAVLVLESKGLYLEFTEYSVAIYGNIGCLYFAKFIAIS